MSASSEPEEPAGVRARTRARKRRADDLSEERPARRLGPLEYVLLALIVLGIAVTIAMAIFNPSA